MIARKHNVNPVTGKCVRCGRNEYDRRNQPACMTTGDYIDKWNSEDARPMYPKQK